MPKSSENNIINCPICGTEMDAVSLHACRLCGFEPRVYLSEVPDEEVQRIAAARKRWELHMAREAHMRELEAQLEEERRLKKIREEEESRQARERAEREQQQAQEAEFWKQCQKTNTIESLNSYLSRYPQGRFKEDAQRSLRAFEEARQKKVEEEQQLRQRREEARQVREDMKEKTIQRIAIIGSSKIGRGVAAMLANAGIYVMMLDIIPLNIKNDERHILTARNRVVLDALDEIRNSQPPLLDKEDYINLIQIGNLDDDAVSLAECDWIIETSVENLNIKKHLCNIIDKYRKSDALVSSNTFTLIPNDIAGSMSQGFREYFFVTRFTEPVGSINNIVLVPGPETKQENLERAKAFIVNDLGKTTALVSM